MKLTRRQKMCIMWLGQPPSSLHAVKDDMLRHLASKGIVEFDPETNRVKFTDLGRQVYRDLMGRLPTRCV